jgi:alpha-L-rhamnosidase
LAIEWDLLPLPEQRVEAGLRLADLVRTSGFRISTGFVGTPLVCDALTRTGHIDVGYRLVLQTQCPSWLYPVTMGATTVWERWDSMRPDGSINPGEMTSFNHYALGAIADWLHRVVAGLAPAAPGYRELLVRPRPTAALTRAATSHITPYGKASVAWERTDGRLRLIVQVPVGASAEVCVPGAPGPVRVGHGDHRWDVADPIAELPRRRINWSRATVRDLLDDPATWIAVTEAAVATGTTPQGETQAARLLSPYLGAPATLVAEALAPDDRYPAAKDLRRAIADILAGARSAPRHPPFTAVSAEPSAGRREHLPGSPQPRRDGPNS